MNTNNKVMAIGKVYTNRTEFLESKEVKEIFEGYNNDMPSRLRRTNFIAAYVVNVDPEKNYGRAFKLFWHFEIIDSKYAGMQRLLEVTLGSCIDNGGFQIAKIIDLDFIILSGCFEKSDANRMKCIQNKWIIA